LKKHYENLRHDTWLLRLGLIGDEFKTARHHLLKNLDGCIAWKDPQQAVMQRERLQSAQETNNESIGRCSRRNWNAHDNRCKEEQKRIEIYSRTYGQVI